MSKVLDNYKEFVDGVTSDASKDVGHLIVSLQRLDEQGVDVARLLTAFIGLAAEGGEGLDIVKKLAFHGKDWTGETRQHLIKELGDVSWYWMNACIALGVDPEAVIERNVDKLEARYPGGRFDVHKSQNRKDGDI